jgi:hypothetical protein
MPDNSIDNNNWLDTLSEIRHKDKAEQSDLDLDLSVLSKQDPATRLLALCDAHKLLRRVQSVLLAGKGKIDVFDRTKEYDHSMALIWQGPVSRARIPSPKNHEPYQYILIGATAQKVYVNRKELDFVTPEALKRALVKAAEKPLSWVPKKDKK